MHVNGLWRLTSLCSLLRITCSLYQMQINIRERGEIVPKPLFLHHPPIKKDPHSFSWEWDYRRHSIDMYIDFWHYFLFCILLYMLHHWRSSGQKNVIAISTLELCAHDNTTFECCTLCRGPFGIGPKRSNKLLNMWN